MEAADAGNTCLEGSTPYRKSGRHSSADILTREGWFGLLNNGAHMYIARQCELLCGPRSCSQCTLGFGEFPQNSTDPPEMNGETDQGLLDTRALRVHRCLGRPVQVNSPLITLLVVPEYTTETHFDSFVAWEPQSIGEWWLGQVVDSGDT